MLRSSHSSILAASSLTLNVLQGVEGGEIELLTRGYFKNLGRGDYEKAAKAVEFVVAASKAIGEECDHWIRSDVQQNRVGGEYGPAAGGDVDFALPEEGDEKVNLELLYVTAGSLSLKIGGTAEARIVNANGCVLIDRRRVDKEGGGGVTRVFEKEWEAGGARSNERISVWMYGKKDIRDL